MGVDVARHFPEDYASARDAFRRAAELRGGRLASYPISVRGTDGSELAIDVVYLGPEAPGALLAVSSGIHGVEGFAGSAVQHRLLVEQLDGLELPGGTGVLLVHAVNPHGFASLRRVTEGNVDLNRNFLRHPAEHVPNPGYDELFEAINPSSLDEESEQRCVERLRAYASQHGIGPLQNTLSNGQYVHPAGVQFGGAGDAESNALFRRILAAETRGAPRIAWLDVHTGLGPYGSVELISEFAPDHPAHRRGLEWYGDIVRSTLAGETQMAPAPGAMERAMTGMLPADCELTVFCAEFGTYEPTRVFWALRADNWLAQHGDLESSQGQAIKQELLEVFRPSDPAWQGRILETAARLLRQTRDGLTGRPGSPRK